MVRTAAEDSGRHVKQARAQLVMAAGELARAMATETRDLHGLELYSIGSDVVSVIEAVDGYIAGEIDTERKHA